MAALHDAAAPAAAAFVHRPVLLQEVLQYARQVRHAPLQIVDCTVGGAGHAAALLEAFPTAQLLGIDRDPTAVAVASERLARFGGRAMVRHGRMSQLPELCAAAAVPAVDLLLADFGASSHQLDTPQRGFSFRDAGTPQPLDMRMDPQRGASAWQLIERLEVGELAELLRSLGEERRAGAVARLVKQRLPRTTQELAACVRQVVRPAKDGLDPATRTFMALRMAVNDEMGEIAAWLAHSIDLLRPGGVVMAISFHSLEDRAVKRALGEAARGCRCPPKLPVCVCNRQPILSILTAKVRQATADERQSNPRARSAKLRAAQKRT